MDRTDDFFRFCDEIASRDGLPLPSQERSSHGSGKTRFNVSEASPFNILAGDIGKELDTNFESLQKLAKLVRQRGLFNDKSAETQEITFEVKQSITSLNTKIETLEKHAQKLTVTAQSRFEKSHAMSIVETLKTRLLEVTKEFKDILQLRTEMLRKQERRRELYTPSDTSTMASSSGASGFPTRRGGRTPHKSYSAVPGDTSSVDVEAGGGGPQSLAQMQERGSGYSVARAEAVENVQRVIAELGQIFQKVAGLVQQQDDMIRRIDEDVDTSLINVREGQRQLLDYFHRISSNRALILKIFLILLFFIACFIIFLS